MEIMCFIQSVIPLGYYVVSPKKYTPTVGLWSPLNNGGE